MGEVLHHVGLAEDGFTLFVREVLGADALDDVELVVVFGLHEAGFAHRAFAEDADLCVVLLLGCHGAFHLY